MKNKVTRAVGWSAVDVFVRNGLSFLVIIFLARILSPADFGIIAMLGIFFSIASLFVDGGFSEALIQRQHVSHLDESSIFFFNLLMGFLIALLMCVAAPWIASFYNQPILRDITYVMALNLVINAFGSVHMAILTKKMDFKVIARAGVMATVISGSLAVMAALLGLGVWSLVLQTLSASLLLTAMLWIWHPWRPMWMFSLKSIRSFFGFSGYLMLSGVMYRVYENIYAMIIGKMYMPQDAGFYTQAQRLQQLPVTMLTSIVSRVAFPAFSASADDKAKLVRGLRKALGLTMFMSVPIAIIFLLLAEPLVLMLFGEKWRAAASVLQVLSFVAMVLPLQMLNISMLKALGRTDLNVRVMVIKFVTGLSLLMFASPFGLVAIAWAFVCSNVINLFVNTYYTRILLDYGTIKQLKDVAPYLLAVIPMVMIILLIEYQLEFSNMFKLVLGVLLGGLSYLVTCMLAKLDAVDSMMSVIYRKSGNV